MAYRSDIETELHTTEQEARERGRHDGHSIIDLVVRLTQDMRALVTQEMALARTEVSEKISQVNKGIVSLAVGGAVLYAGLVGLMAAAIFGLATVMALWAAALIVGLVVTIIGGILLAMGRSKLNNLELTQTKESLREDKQWLEHNVKK